MYIYIYLKKSDYSDWHHGSSLIISSEYSYAYYRFFSFYFPYNHFVTLLSLALRKICFFFRAIVIAVTSN